MALFAKASNSQDFELVPSGNQQAVCAFVEDIGTHEGSYQGKATLRHQVVICWELSEKMTKGENIGKPFMVSKFYTLSLDQKANLRKDLESWRGRAFTDDDLKNGFDIERLKGVNCLLNIIHEKKEDKVRARVASISPVIKGMPMLNVFNAKAPEWISRKRAESIEAREADIPELAEMADVAGEDGCPF
jgi:hypothetical protein